MFCPDCPAVRAARALVFGDALWTRVATLALPFVLVALVLAIFLRRLERHDDAHD